MFLNDFDRKLQKDEAERVFKTLIDEYHFDEFVTGKLSFFEWDCKYGHAYIKNGGQIFNGACRGVIMGSRVSNYVYKFDLHFESDDIPYCSNEEYVYELAKTRNAEKGFCPIEKILDLEVEGHTLPIYILPYCDVDHTVSAACYDKLVAEICEEYGYDKEHVSDEERDEVECMADDACYDEDTAVDYAHDIWTEVLFVNVMGIINELDINDLHTGNWGYLNGELVITDYAGYDRNLRAKEVA